MGDQTLPFDDLSVAEEILEQYRVDLQELALW